MTITFMYQQKTPRKGNDALHNYEKYFNSFRAVILQMDWRDASIAFLDTHITASTVGVVNGKNGERLGSSKALTDAKYVIAKERLQKRFENMSDEHMDKYTIFLEAIKSTEELCNVSEDVFHELDFINGLEEDTAIQKAISIKLEEQIKHEQRIQQKREAQRFYNKALARRSK